VAKDIMRDFILDTNRQEGVTFLITTHDMQDIERLCQRIIIINYGDIIYDGPLDTIKRRYLHSKIVSVFFEDTAPAFEVPGCRIAEHSKYELRLRVDLRATSVRKVVEFIMAHCQFADLVITDPPIEEIIARIYKETGRIDPRVP
jgi:ABC-2 type transport system ATP-binding protein